MGFPHARHGDYTRYINLAFEKLVAIRAFTRCQTMLLQVLPMHTKDFRIFMPPIDKRKAIPLAKCRRE
jgi:hypothetical protein